MSVTDVSQQLATEFGLSYDRESGIITDVYSGYRIVFIMQNNLRQIIISISNDAGQIPEKGALKQTYKGNKEVLSSPSVQGYHATYSIPSAISNKDKLKRDVAAAAVLTEFLKASYLRNCSELSGRPDESSCYYASGGLRFLTRNEYSTERGRAQSSFNERNSKRGNPVTGIANTLIGSFTGLFAMVLIGQLGFVSPWTGLVMGVCVTKGYELPSDKFGTAGLVCSILIMVGMTYLGNQLDWAITIVRAYETDVFGAFPVVDEMVKTNELLPVYYRNLALCYFMTLCGAPPTIYGLMRSRQLLNVFYPIGLETHESVVHISSKDGTDSE